MNVAKTLRLAVMGTTHDPVPLHAPVQPTKNQPAAGVALNVTLVPLEKLALQEPKLPQLIPLGELVTVPWPLTFTPKE